MLIVADQDIAHLAYFFGGLGSLELLPGRAMNAALVEKADALLVRSITPVHQELLVGSSVGFVGTCTIGVDHLDLAYLERAGIQWASAPGCNARAVVDYVVSSLCTLARQQQVDLAERCFGVVGAGAVGGRLVAVLRALGFKVLVCDPPRAAQEGGDFVEFSEIIAQCDVISLHTPLNPQSRHLFNRTTLSSLLPDTWLLNTSRGAVIDNQALLEVLRSAARLSVVLDVWEHEPAINPDLAALCSIATPHIAGHSLEGKVRGTVQIYQAFCAWQNIPVATERLALDFLPACDTQRLDGLESPLAALSVLYQAVYDPLRDDAALRASLRLTTQARAAQFDRLRAEYPLRRELNAVPIALSAPQPKLSAALSALGVRLC